jgi:hypothetical protein
MKLVVTIFSFILIPTIVYDSFGQGIDNHNKLIVGTDEFVSNTCFDSCIYEYTDYTVITKAHSDSPGEGIVITIKKNILKSYIDVRDEYKAQYFGGIVNDKAIIDVGTGLIRTIFIYDLTSKCLVDSIKSIVDEPKVINGKLFYSTMMAKDKVKAMNLPLCDNPDIEFSGYVEYIYYNFMNGKKTSSNEYKCIN